ncbi:MAG: hypothetical protein AB7S70_04135 [Hyphomicrobium sp.]
MTMLLMQTFLLMLGAFLLGASLACLIRRGTSAGAVEAAAGVAAGSGIGAALPAATAKAAETSRFERALVGTAGGAVPPVFQPGAPVIEVQPKPVAEAPPAPRAPQAAPAPAPAPRPAPQQAAPAPAPRPAPAAVSTPPERVAVPTTAESAEPVSQPPQPRPASEPAGESYAQIAAAQAAAALAVAKARQAAADAVASPPKDDAGAVEAQDEGGETRFGTPVASTLLAPESGEAVDDLTRIRGIDFELKERLVRYGIHRFSQIADWSEDDVRGVNQTLGFDGRVEREAWVEQARILAAGGVPSIAPARPQPAAVEPGPVNGDRLHRIIGVDPESEALLRANGVTQLEHIAAWSAADVAHFEGIIGQPGRIAHESWVEQALFLTGKAPPAPELEPAEDAAASASLSQAAAAAASYAPLRSVRSEALRGEGYTPGPAGAVDDLKRIRGIGVLIEKKLYSLGVTAYEQVANWTRDDIDRISQVLDFKGRIERENWVEQARILASGGQTEFSRRADRGEA